MSSGIKNYFESFSPSGVISKFKETFTNINQLIYIAIVVIITIIIMLIIGSSKEGFTPPSPLTLQAREAMSSLQSQVDTPGFCSSSAVKTPAAFNTAATVHGIENGTISQSGSEGLSNLTDQHLVNALNGTNH